MFRCYRKGLSYEQCISELRKHSGEQFDPELVERFIKFTNSAGYPLLPSTPAYVSGRTIIVYNVAVTVSNIIFILYPTYMPRPDIAGEDIFTSLSHEY